MKPIYEKINFASPNEYDVKRLTNILNEANLFPDEIKYKFSKLYSWEVKLWEGKLVLGYIVRYKRPNKAPAFTTNHMIIFDSVDGFILQDKLGNIHGEGNKEDITDVEFRKFTYAKKIADHLGFEYKSEGRFSK